MSVVEHVLTALTSYGTVAPHRQAELIRGLGQTPVDISVLVDPDLAELIARILKK